MTKFQMISFYLEWLHLVLENVVFAGPPFTWLPQNT